MDKQINLMELLKLYAKRWWCLLLAIIVAAGITGVYTKLFVTPMYTSYGTLYSENSTRKDVGEAGEETLNAVMVRQELVTTYAEMLSSNSFLEMVAEESKLGYTGSEILKMISMSDKNETEILVVSVTTPNPEDSQIIAQKIVDLAPDFVKEITKGKGTVTVLDRPVTDYNPSSPNVSKNMRVGGFIGLLLSLIVVFIVEMLDNKVKDADDVADAFKYPVLGEVPYFTTTSKNETKKKKRTAAKTSASA